MVTDNVIFLADRSASHEVRASEPPVMVSSVLLDLKDRLQDVNDLLQASAKVGEVPRSLPDLDLALEELMGSLRTLEEAAAIAASVANAKLEDDV